MRILAASAESSVRIPVRLGQVACPRIGSVDLDQCRECPYLSRLDGGHADGAGDAYVVCSLTTAEASDTEW